MKKNISILIVNIVITLIIAFVLFYLCLPSINIHNFGFWVYLITVILVFGVLNSLGDTIASHRIKLSKNKLIPFGICGGIFVVIILVAFINSPIFMSGKYYNRITINSDVKFSDGVDKVDFNKLALLDKSSSQKLGDRVMGQMSDLVSQFYVSDLYTQINYNNEIVRVTPLEYSDMIKYFTNRREGVKGYIMVNSVTGESTLVKLDKGMKYVQSAMFFENVERYLRFKYPFDNFGEVNFEVDNDGNPYWIMPVIKYAGINQRPDVSHVIILNAITGEAKKYSVDETPSWIDHVYSASLVISQVDDWGSYAKGFFNTIFGQKGMTMTTDGYNYLVMNDDVYLYTGITSIVSDESNLGFILTNLRTKETNFYSCPGAEEYSAMDSAKGQVQQMDYTASFPLLINLEGQPTYLISLKDNAGLVKMYAFVSVTDYQKVVVTDANLGIETAANNYLANVGLKNNDNDTKITIKEIYTTLIDGNTYYYFVDSNNNKYRANIKINYNKLPFVKVGDTLDITYSQKEVREILSIK